MSFSVDYAKIIEMTEGGSHMKKVLNVFGILFSVVFSVVLIPVLVATPVVSALSGFTQPEAIQEVVANVDYGEIIDTALITADPEMAEQLEEIGFSGDTVQELMETDTVGDVLDVYVEDMFAVLEGEEIGSSFSAETIQDIISENKEELLPFVNQFVGMQTGGEVTVSDEEAEKMLDTLMEEHGDVVMDMLPTAEELGIVVPDASQDVVEDGTIADTSVGTPEATEPVRSPAIADSFTVDTGFGEINIIDVLQSLHNGFYVRVFILVAAVLSVLILLCRWVRFKGFMWIGVVYLIAAGLSLLATFPVKTLSLAEMMGESMGGFDIMESIIPVFVAGMNKGTVILASVGVGAILIFTVARIILKKTQK